MTQPKQQIIDLTELFHGKSLPPPPTEVDFVEACLVVDAHNLLGEGCVYDDRTDTVLWTDILGHQLHTLQLNHQNATQALHTVYSNLPKKLCSFGLLEDHVPTPDSLPLLCAWEDGFQLYDIATQTALSPLSRGEDVNPAKGLTRLNDGRVDPTGRRFLCGGFYGNQKGVTMKVYRVEEAEEGGLLQHEPIVDAIEVTNSIGWSPDGTTMYLADSPTRHIQAYEYDVQTGAIVNPRPFHAKLDSDVGVPDGSCVDADGHLWNAVWKNGAEPSCVQRIDPATGLVTFTVHMPDATSQVSCCCFGGANMDLLFITTACESRDPALEPHAGGLYAARLPFRGRPEHKLKFTIPKPQQP